VLELFFFHLKKRLRKNDMKCSRFSGFIGKKHAGLENTYTLYRARCKQWKCPECSQYLRSKWRSHLARKIGELNCPTWCFLTLTAPSYNGASFAVQHSLSHKLFKTKMNTLMSWLKNELGKFEYVRIFELQSRGAVHCHMLLSAHFPDAIEKKTGKNKGQFYSERLRDELIKLGFGYIHDIENLIAQPLLVASYITKYITKESRMYGVWLEKNTHYIRCSKRIGALKDKALTSDEWRVFPQTIGYELRHGFELIDGDKSKHQLHFITIDECDESDNYY